MRIGDLSPQLFNEGLEEDVDDESVRIAVLDKTATPPPPPPAPPPSSPVNGVPIHPHKNPLKAFVFQKPQNSLSVPFPVSTLFLTVSGFHSLSLSPPKLVILSLENSLSLSLSLEPADEDDEEHRMGQKMGFWVCPFPGG